MKKLILLFYIWLALISCKTTKSIEATVDQKESIQTETTVDYEKQLTEILERLTNERIRITVQKSDYDTEKPILPETGKPPVLSETNTIIEQEKDVLETKQTQENEQEKLKQLEDETVDTNIVVEQKQRVITVWYTAGLFLMVLVALCLFIFIVVKGKK